MNLELIIAHSGLGKTEYILNEIEKNRFKNKIIVLTPEQNGYNFEKMLCKKFKSTFNIDVMNFNSFARKISKKLFFKTEELITDEAKLFYYLEISKIIKNDKNFITNRIKQDSNFINTVSEIVNELLDYDVNINDLKKYLHTDNIQNKNKIKDILEIYEKYIELVLQNNKLDKNNFLTYIYNSLDFVDISDYIFYIDGYYNFNKQEFKIIEKLIEKSKKVYFSVISDINRYLDINLSDKYDFSTKDTAYKFINYDDIKYNYNYSLDIFRKSHEVVANINDTIKKLKIKKFNILTIKNFDKGAINFLIEIENGIVACVKKVSDYHPIRYKNNMLKTLANEYHKILKSPKKQIDNSIKIIKSPTQELELRQIAREIYKIKKENENITDDDIAILYRDSSYEKYINLFEDYGINLHLDKDIDITNHRLIKFIVNILNYSDDNFTESITNILKTQLVNINKIYERNVLKFLIFGDCKVSNSLLKKEFDENKINYLANQEFFITNNQTLINNLKPLAIHDISKILNTKLVATINDLNKDYFVEKTKNYSANQLKIIQFILQDLTKKLNSLKKQKTIQGFIKKIESIFDFFEINMTLEKEVEEYDDLAELQLNNIDRQVYSKTLNIINNINKNINFTVSFKEFRELLTISLKKIKYRNIPESSDFVVMSTMDLAKVENKKIVFVVGFNKGILPKNISENNILSDIDKNLFFENKIILSPDSKSMLIDEEFVSYIALTRSTERLIITYSETDSSYSKNYSSTYLHTLENIFPEIKTLDIDSIINFELSQIENYIKSYEEKNFYTQIYTKKEFQYINNKINSLYNLLKDAENIYKESVHKMLTEMKEINKIINYKNLYDEDAEIYTNLDDKNYNVKNIDYNLSYTGENLITCIEDKNKKIFIEKKGETLTKYSASKLMQYTKNPYIYFVKYILGIFEEEKNEITAINKGSFYHAVMDSPQVKEYLEKKYSFFDIDDTNQLNKTIEEAQRLVENVINTSTNNDIKKFLMLINTKYSNKYLLKKEILNLSYSIIVELNYMKITEYKIFDTEKDFEIKISSDFITCNLNGVKKEIKLSKKYNIKESIFKGKIDRIDKKDKNYLIIDYKSSKTEFDYNDFYNRAISQLLSYMLAVEMIYKEKLENIFGVFYRELASDNDYNKYRLRGLINKDILFSENFAQENSKVIFGRITKTGKIHSSDVHRFFDSKEMEKLTQLNIENMLLIIEKIQNFDFYVENPLEYLYKYANSENTTIETTSEKNSAKDLKNEILKL